VAGSCGHSDTTLCGMKGGGFLDLVEELLTSHKELCSMVSVSYLVSFIIRWLLRICLQHYLVAADSSKTSDQLISVWCRSQ